MARSNIDTSPLLLSLTLIAMIFVSTSCMESRRSGEPFKTVFVSDDSLARYSLGIYGRLEQEGQSRWQSSSIPVEIIVTAPHGNTYTDTQNLSISGTVSRQVGRWLDIGWSYREGVQFPENGEWSFLIKYKSGEIVVKDMGITITRLLD